MSAPPAVRGREREPEEVARGGRGLGPKVRGGRGLGPQEPEGARALGHELDRLEQVAERRDVPRLRPRSGADPGRAPEEGGQRRRDRPRPEDASSDPPHAAPIPQEHRSCEVPCMERV